MAAQVYYSPFIPAFNGNGAPVPGAKLYFFYTNTNNKAPIYSDEGLTITLGNPVSADLAGKFPNVYLNDSITYRVRITDPGDIPLGADIDPYVPGTALKGEAGPPGVGGNTFLTLSSMKALNPVQFASAILADGTKPPIPYAYVTGNFTSRANDPNIVKLDSTPLSVGALVAGGTVSGLQPVTNKFVVNIDGAVRNALGDRVFMGGAVGYDGNYPNDDPAHQDWYTTYERLQGRGNGIIVSSQTAILTNNNNGAAVGLTVAARTSNFHPAVGGAVGLEAHVVNDNTASSHDAWAIYSEATRDSDAVGAIITYEADSRNKGAFHAITPYLQSAKQSVVLQVASGGALTGVGCEDVSAGINFRHNPTKFGAGIVFGNSSIRGTDGNGVGIGNAILFARGHQMAWCNAAGDQTSFIYGAGATGTSKMSISFLDLGMTIGGPSDTSVAIFRPVGAAVNYLDFSGAIINEQPVIAVNGFNANIDLKLTPKGGGTLAIGNASNFVAKGTGTPVFTSTLPSGISPTVKEWWAIHNANGEFRLIPLFGV